MQQIERHEMVNYLQTFVQLISFHLSLDIGLIMVSRHAEMH